MRVRGEVRGGYEMWKLPRWLSSSLSRFLMCWISTSDASNLWARWPRPIELRSLVSSVYPGVGRVRAGASSIASRQHMVHRRTMLV